MGIHSRYTSSERFFRELHTRKPEAFEVLYNEFYRALVAYAVKKNIPDSVAGDLVQDIFIHIWEKQTLFESMPSLKTFLYTSVRNKCFNYLSHKDVEERYADSVLENTEQATNETDLEEEEIYRQLFLTIEKLPPRCREIFERHLEGMKNEEIAELYALSIETVKTQKKRAVRFLKEQLTPAFFLFLISDLL